MASLLSELELGLGSLVRQSGTQASRKMSPSEEDVLGRFFFSFMTVYYNIVYLDLYLYLYILCMYVYVCMYKDVIVFAYFAGILVPNDEFQYWAGISDSAEKKSVKERAAHFYKQFKPIQKVSMYQ